MSALIGQADWNCARVLCSLSSMPRASDEVDATSLDCPESGAARGDRASEDGMLDWRNSVMELIFSSGVAYSVLPTTI